MTRISLTTTLAVVALALGGCATQSVSHHQAPTLGGPVSRVVELPGQPGAGNPREVRVLVDEPALKLATIVLRGGTVLPTHQSDVPDHRRPQREIGRAHV